MSHTLNRTLKKGNSHTSPSLNIMIEIVECPVLAYWIWWLLGNTRLPDLLQSGPFLVLIGVLRQSEIWYPNLVESPNLEIEG